MTGRKRYFNDACRKRASRERQSKEDLKICMYCKKYNFVNNKCKILDEVCDLDDTCDKFE